MANAEQKMEIVMLGLTKAKCIRPSAERMHKVISKRQRRARNLG